MSIPTGVPTFGEGSLLALRRRGEGDVEVQALGGPEGQRSFLEQELRELNFELVVPQESLHAG